MSAEAEPEIGRASAMSTVQNGVPAATRRLTDETVNRADAEAVERPWFGDIVADRVTREIGSWRFIIAYFGLLLLWMAVNTAAWLRHWDPYPFIFLNLILSFQGAFAAPIILMSQNRQEDRDRLEERYDHSVNLRAEREIAAIQARIEEIGNVALAEIAALRAEQAAVAARLGAILPGLEGRAELEPEQIMTERDARAVLSRRWPNGKEQDDGRRSL